MNNYFVVIVVATDCTNLHGFFYSLRELLVATEARKKNKIIQLHIDL